MASKVFIAIPNMGWINTRLVHRMRDWASQGIYSYEPEGHRPIPNARNHCVEQFLKSDATHLWFIDSDTAPKVSALPLLLQSGCVAISGVVRQVKMDVDGFAKPVGMVMKRNKCGELKAAGGEGVTPIDACGFGCVMVERSVFEAVGFPWFEERFKDRRVVGSDMIFCEKMEALDLPLHAHFDVICTHRKELVF